MVYKIYLSFNTHPYPVLEGRYKAKALGKVVCWHAEHIGEPRVSYLFSESYWLFKIYFRGLDYVVLNILANLNLLPEKSFVLLVDILTHVACFLPEIECLLFGQEVKLDSSLLF